MDFILFLKIAFVFIYFQSFWTNSMCFWVYMASNLNIFHVFWWEKMWRNRKKWTKKNSIPEFFFHFHNDRKQFLWISIFRFHKCIIIKLMVKQEKSTAGISTRHHSHTNITTIRNENLHFKLISNRFLRFWFWFYFSRIFSMIYLLSSFIHHHHHYRPHQLFNTISFWLPFLFHIIS